MKILPFYNDYDFDYDCWYCFDSLTYVIATLSQYFFFQDYERYFEYCHDDPFRERAVSILHLSKKLFIISLIVVSFFLYTDFVKRKTIKFQLLNINIAKTIENLPNFEFLISH